MGIQVLGPVQVDGAATRLGSRDRTVLAALVACRGETLSPEQLADAVWGEQPPASWGKNLQGCVCRLRKQLGLDAIQTESRGYRLTLSADDVDAWSFDDLVTRAQELLTLGEPERAMFTATRALSLWRGRPFAELEEWARGAQEASRLYERRWDVEELQLEAGLRAGRHREVHGQALRMVEAVPVRGRRWMLLARAQYQTGQQSEALRTLNRLRRLLAEELGLDPDPEVLALEQAILRHDRSLAVATAIPVIETSPYLGLRAYDEVDTEWFFGRDAEVRQARERLAQESMLAVVGPSGSGKSSLVRAGIVPWLRQDGREVVVITPGRHPAPPLTSPKRGQASPILVIDQFEEVYSLCDDPEEREVFLDAVVHHASNAPVVVALRADRMGDVAAHRDLAQSIQRGLFLLAAMTEEGLRAAIEQPARQVGLIVEPGLVDLLVREAEGEPGALPLLSHCLRETWLRREARTLTVAGYQASGGIRGAVAQSAEALYARVPEEERHLLRDLLLRLVTPGGDAEPVRVRVPRRSLVADPAHSQLVDMLIEARLVTSDDGVLGIAHESLARAWPRLRGWLDDDVEGLRVMHHLAATADSWEGLGRPHSELYRGVRLSQAAAWEHTHPHELTRVERDFLAASRQVVAEEQRSAYEQARRQTRMIHSLRLSLAGAGVLLSLTLVAGFIALGQAEEANSSARKANDAALSESARRVGAKALVTPGLSEALLLGVAGVRLDDSPDTRRNLVGVLERNPRLRDSMPLRASDEVFRMAFHPDGGTVVTYNADHHVVLYDARTGAVLAEHQAGPRRSEWDWHGEVAFSPEGETIAVTTSPTAPTPVLLLDASTLEPVDSQPRGLPRRPWQGMDLSFDRDGSHLALVARRVRADGRVVPGRRPVLVAWRLRDGSARPLVVTATAARAWSVELSPDGRYAYTNPPLTRLELRTGERTRLITAPFRALGGVELSRDGRLLAVGGGPGGETLILDTETGGTRHRLLTKPQEVQESRVWEPRFTPDGRTLVTVTAPDRRVQLWDTATGQQHADFRIDDGADTAIAVGADGTALHAASTPEHALRTWDLVHEGLTRQVHAGASLPAQFADVAPGGRTVALVQPLLVGGRQGERRWFLDTRTGRTVGPEDRSGFSLGGGSWSPDGTGYVTAVGGVIREWDLATGRVVRRAKPAGVDVATVDHSPDGVMLAISALDGTVLRLDASSLQRVGAPLRLDTGVPVISLGPDRRTALALTGDAAPSEVWRDFPSAWAVLDLATGDVLSEGPTGFPAVYAAVSPDGRYGAISGANGELAVLDLRMGGVVRPPVIAHDGGVFIFKYSSDGTRLLTSGTDGAVVLWDAVAALPLATVHAPGRPFVSADFVDDDTVLISDWGGGRAWTWDTALEQALDLACQAAGRELTAQEWQDNFGDRPYEETCPDEVGTSLGSTGLAGRSPLRRGADADLGSRLPGS